MKIVVAEDEVLNQRLTMILLRRLGHQVHCVSNGLELVDYLSHEPADFAFIDIHMPFKNGIEAAAEIVRRWRPSTRPVLIALSASADSEDVKDCFQAGMDGFLRKPVSAHTLQDAIETWKERRCPNFPTPWRQVADPEPSSPLPLFSSQ